MIHFPRRPGYPDFARQSLDPGPRFFFQPAATRSGTPAQGRCDGVSGSTIRRHLALAALLALAACGKAAGLSPPPGQSLPVAPRGATATPTPAELLTPTAQQRPQRGDELLRSSQERRDDAFNLPPE